MTSVSSFEDKYKLSGWLVLKHIASFAAALSGTIAANNDSFLIPAIYYINSYMAIDLVYIYDKPDMILHHVCGLSFFSVILFYDIQPEYLHYFTVQLVRFEYSTLFYSGGPLVLHYLSSAKDDAKIKSYIPIVKNIFQVGFACAFIKFRIYDFAVRIMFQPNTYKFAHFPGWLSFVHLMITTWVFYSLNIYWLQLILMRVLSPMKNNA
jgi:hypothetical protein